MKKNILRVENSAKKHHGAKKAIIGIIKLLPIHQVP